VKIDAYLSVATRGGFWAAWEGSCRPAGEPWTMPRWTGRVARAPDAETELRRILGGRAAIVTLPPTFAAAAAREASGRRPGWKPPPPAPPPPRSASYPDDAFFAKYRKRYEQPDKPFDRWMVGSDYRLDSAIERCDWRAAFSELRLRDIRRQDADAWWSPPSGAPRVAAPGDLERFGLRPPVRHDDVARAYRRIVSAERLHPDQGGDPAAFIALTQTRDRLIATCGAAS